MTAKRVFRVFVPIFFPVTLMAQGNGGSTAAPEPYARIKLAGEKELYLPGKVYRTPDRNNYFSDTSEFSFSRMAESKNIVVFWSKEFGKDPMANPDEKKRFDVTAALPELERFYDYYVNDLKLVQKGKSLTDQYKMILYVIGGSGATAFGGGTENKIGMLWTPAVRMSKAPYGALAHELGHSFQYMISADNGRGPRGAISEMSAQYMLWQVYPEWMRFENYHLKDFMKQTHYAFLHPINMYHSPYVFEYWSNKHGIEFFGNFSRATLPGEDPVTTYKRITNLTQEQFNDEMFDACRRFITWDMKRIEAVARQYANQHTTSLTAKEGWFTISQANCPQNYGYNGIQLKVPRAGTKVTLDFQGIAGAAGFTAVKTDNAGWRYGFVAYQKNGTRVYGATGKDANGRMVFQVPKETEYLWLVVMGAPTEHWPVALGRQRQETDAKPQEEQWPYCFKITGTAPVDSIVRETAVAQTF
ncbi:DUF6055 domain-containing protein [Sediminibacterium soli]|uniref:DUF6055 domain-containing protein n=1 Tax=Sediminibacterium soli TaxID=2698829 RepID=UPI0013797299|nr:DUF6055 domain-containing protein [Sediminibacterium soli]NCI45061.1 hypothetical protein [Sediminibacterium soli]